MFCRIPILASLVIPSIALAVGPTEVGRGKPASVPFWQSATVVLAQAVRCEEIGESKYRVAMRVDAVLLGESDLAQTREVIAECEDSFLAPYRVPKVDSKLVCVLGRKVNDEGDKDVLSFRVPSVLFVMSKVRSPITKASSLSAEEVGDFLREVRTILAEK